MRLLVVAVVAVVALAAAGPLLAAPAVPRDAVNGSTIMLVRGGCGSGWHPQTWRDRWGSWHRRCVPNRW